MTQGPPAVAPAAIGRRSLHGDVPSLSAVALMAGAILLAQSAPAGAQIAAGAVVYGLGVVTPEGLTAVDAGLLRELARTSPSAPSAAGD